MKLTTLFEGLLPLPDFDEAKDVGRLYGLYCQYVDNKYELYIGDQLIKTLKASQKDLAHEFLLSSIIGNENNPPYTSEWKPYSKRDVVYKAVNSGGYIIPGFTTTKLKEAIDYKAYYDYKLIVKIELDGHAETTKETIILKGPKELERGFTSLTILPNTPTVLKSEENKNEILVLHKVNTEILNLDDLKVEES
jgi:hypothetical protein